MMGKHSEHKQKVATTFNTVCDVYDCEELRFFRSSAQRMLDLLSLTPDERLIDVAAGTGHITLAAAQRLNAGTVHSVDLSEGMLQQASDKARPLGLSNIVFTVVILNIWKSRIRFLMPQAVVLAFSFCLIWKVACAQYMDN